MNAIQWIVMKNLKITVATCACFDSGTKTKKNLLASGALKLDHY
jgi:hypothetical protein